MVSHKTCVAANPNCHCGTLILVHLLDFTRMSKRLILIRVSFPETTLEVVLHLAKLVWGWRPGFELDVHGRCRERLVVQPGNQQNCPPSGYVSARFLCFELTFPQMTWGGGGNERARKEKTVKFGVVSHPLVRPPECMIRIQW